jgi:TolB-like protein/Flp pilus assembly protein TadD
MRASVTSGESASQMAELESYRFGPFVVDRQSACLRRDGATVPLRPKSFDVLVYLAQHPGRLVARAELIDNVWHNVTVTPNSLAQCIKEIRQALQDDAQTIIETISKRGYLFASPVTAVDPEPPSRAGTAVIPGDVNRALPLPDRPSIAVLPFDNMSGDPDQEHFADGISEDLITGLSRVRWLFVIARNSTFVYKGQAVDVRQVAEKLGVRYVLEGSVRRAGQRLRVSAQLIDATTGGHHWAEQYDRELGDIFAIQDEITSSVIASIQPRLLAAEGIRALARSPGDLGAWELVARAQTHVWRLNRSDNEAALEALNRAVAVFPDYAPARSLLGFCLVFSAHNGWIDRDRGLQAARPHIGRAVALDDCDPWGQIALGYWSMMAWRTEESLAAFRRAVSLNPSSAAAHCYLSHGLAFSGQCDEAIAHGKEAIRLSPLDPDTAMFLGGITVANYLAGRYADAFETSEQLLRLRPGFHGAQRLRCASLAQMGRVEEARQSLAAVRLEQPQLSIEWIKSSVPYQTPDLMEHFLEGMRKAGLT